MMFVTVGTLHHQFGRMVEAVRTVVDKQIYKGEIIVQSGHTKGFESVKNVIIKPFMKHPEMWSLMSQSEILLMHGGEGSLLESLEWSTNLPIIFPRDPVYGEHVDSYQEKIADEAMKKKWGLAVKNQVDAVKMISNWNKINHKKPCNFSNKNIRNQALIDYLNQLDVEWFSS